MKSLLLTKLKATAWGLLLAASLSVGAIALTYRSAAAQPAAPADHPAATARSSADRDDLEALRLEVEALRLELKATKERVKAMENQAQCRRRGAGGEPPDLCNGRARRTVEHKHRFTPTELHIHAAQLNGPNLPLQNYIFTHAQLTKPSTAASEDVKQLAAEVEAAAKKLQEKPDDPQALEELNRAVGRLKKAKEPKRDP